MCAPTASRQPLLPARVIWKRLGRRRAPALSAAHVALRSPASYPSRPGGPFPMLRETGRVLLVGAGPGAADLLTLRAARAIEGAEAVLYDALVSDDVVAIAPWACLKIQ